MAQYVSRYIPEYATITAPLRALTKKETPWQWSDEQQHAFDKLKDSLTKSHVMSYFNPAQETKVIVDASRQGYQLCESSTQQCGVQILTNREGNASDPVGLGTFSSLPLRI